MVGITQWQRGLCDVRVTPNTGNTTTTPATGASKATATQLRPNPIYESGDHVIGTEHTFFFVWAISPVDFRKDDGILQHTTVSDFPVLQNADTQCHVSPRLCTRFHEYSRGEAGGSRRCTPHDDTDLSRENDWLKTGTLKGKQAVDTTRIAPLGGKLAVC